MPAGIPLAGGLVKGGHLAPVDPERLDQVDRAAMRPQIATDAMIADRVRIVGYDARRDQNEWRIVIYWQARAKLEAWQASKASDRAHA